MTRRKRTFATAQRPTSRWFVVERWCHCCIGEHDIRVGQWARWTARRDGTADCAECLETRYGIQRPGSESAAPVHEEP